MEPVKLTKKVMKEDLLECAVCGALHDVDAPGETTPALKACMGHMAEEIGWQRTVGLTLTENDIIEIITALKHYHTSLKLSAPDWTAVRKSLRSIIAKLNIARGAEDNDPVSEE